MSQEVPSRDERLTDAPTSAPIRKWAPDIAPRSRVAEVAVVYSGLAKSSTASVARFFSAPLLGTTVGYEVLPPSRTSPGRSSD